MCKVSYKLLEQNRPVTLKIGENEAILLYRDLKRILKDNECELMYKDTCIVGPNIELTCIIENVKHNGGVI